MKIIISIILTCFTFLLFAQEIKVKTGIEVLAEQHYSILKGKKVGLVTNPTGVDHNLNSTIDLLYAQKDFQLVALFGPEHGARGDQAAGDKVENYTDKKTGLPVYSLYGKIHKPTKEMLNGVDVLIYDIQDIGCRSYTYISTMGQCMEAAAENNLEFIVLDRPNPLGGIRIEGNIVDSGYFSFVSKYPIPYIYGLTCGELAKLLNEEHLLGKNLKCNLTVIKLEGWKRTMTFKETGLPWVPSSPHIPNAETAMYYAATGILGELEFISEGIGYTLPFQLLGAEWIDENLLAKKMNQLNLQGVLFRPMTFKPFYGQHKDSLLHGVQIYILDAEQLNLMDIQFYFLQVHNEMYPDKNPFAAGKKSRFSMFDRVCGSDFIRKTFTEKTRFEDIKPYLDKDIKNFRNLSQKYYLYKN